jgi:DNA-directed RNA polymerase specialized sigma24 family protein
MVSSFEALAVAQLLRWCSERATIAAGQTVAIQASGYTPARKRSHDSRMVAVLSFEQAFNTLEDRQQTALLLAYRDGLHIAAVAAILRCTVPVAQARVSGARLSLAHALDRRHLL